MNKTKMPEPVATGAASGPSAEPAASQLPSVEPSPIAAAVAAHVPGAVLVAEFVPKDLKKFMKLSAKDKQTVIDCLADLNSVQSAGKKGHRVTELERIMGHEMGIYGTAMTDSCNFTSKDEIDKLVHHLRCPQRVYASRQERAGRRPQTAIWDAVTDTTGTTP